MYPGQWEGNRPFDFMTHILWTVYKWLLQNLVLTAIVSVVGDKISWNVILFKHHRQSKRYWIITEVHTWNTIQQHTFLMNAVYIEVCAKASWYRSVIYQKHRLFCGVGILHGSGVSDIETPRKVVTPRWACVEADDGNVMSGHASSTAVLCSPGANCDSDTKSSRSLSRSMSIPYCTKT